MSDLLQDQAGVDRMSVEPEFGSAAEDAAVIARKRAILGWARLQCRECDAVGLKRLDRH